MSEMSVEVGLNVEADQYLTTMGQAVAITKQYTGVADGLNGRVADLNKGLVSLTERFTGFNKVNSVAVDTAAAYQKQLSGIEAKAALTGKSFAALEKTTKGFAKDFPIGMGQAVQVVESLQKAGIKSEMQIARLGKSWINLGAATGTSAAAIGTEMLQLNKSMGNGIAQFDALADSAVGATAKIGGSVPSVISFSKALAPVASTVGLSQTAVIGLSTAMSSLGEDGYRAANTFNKVLLDMNRSIRDGGPDLKAYADLMGMTADSLKSLFKSDPAEVLSRFSDAVAKQGPAISKSLDALGFDSVRDTRSLTALANAGGPREAIAAAVGSYGSGSTAKAAEVAMEGVNDQAQKLQESMSQVVANVGTPLLGIAKVQLQIANQVSGLMAGITESAPGQALLGAAGAGGVLGSVASGVLTVGALGAGYRFAKRGITGSSAYGGFQAGRGAAMPGGVGGDTVMGSGTRMERMGYLAQSAMMGLRPGVGVPGLEGAGGAVGSMARASGSLALSGMAKWQAAGANFVGREMGLSPVGQTAAGQAAMSGMGQASTSMMMAARNLDRDGFNAAKAQLADASKNARAMLAESSGRGITRGIGDVARYSAAGIGSSAMMAGSMGLRAGAVGMSGLSALGLTGPTAILMGGAALGMYGMGKYKESNENVDRIGGASKDIFGAFNNFAAAAGMAGRGLVSFQAQVEKNTVTLTDQNTTMDQAIKLSQAEINQATGGGYQAAFKIQGNDRSVDSITGQVQSVLGVNARPQEVSRAIMDIASQTSVDVAEQVGKNIASSYKSGNIDYKSMVQNISSQESYFADFITGVGFGSLAGPNEVQTTLATQLSGVGMQKAAAANSVYGGTANIGGQEINAGTVTALSEAKKIYDSALGIEVKSAGEVKAINKALSNILGLSDQQALNAGLGTDATSGKALTKGNSFEQMMMDLAAYNGADGKSQIAMAYNAITESGIDLGKVDYSKFGTKMPAPERESRNLEDSFNRVAGASTKLSDALYGAEKAARDFNTIPSALTEAQKGSLSPEARAILDYQNNPTDSGKYRAADRLVAAAQSGTQNSSQAAFALALEAAKAPEGYKKDVLETAIQLQQRQMSLTNAGRPGLEVANQQAAVGRQASQMPLTSNANYNTAIQSQITMGAQAQTAQVDALSQMNRAFGAMQAQIGSIMRSTGIATGAVMRDQRLNENWAREDFRTQRRYAREDFGISRRRSERDFGISMARSQEDFATSERYASEDYTKSRSRATADFNKQQLYAEQDFNRTKTRANEDYETGRNRATRDFNKQIERANRDFRLSQTRADDDYNRSRSRSMEDFNKQVKRMVEDSAKSMYDPFKRISAQMVMDAGQLVTNLKDQTAALNKQVGNLAEARSMGLSEDTIKALSLSDAANAQQLSRLVEDMKGNASLVDQLNSSVASKATAAGALATDQGNVSYSRMVEDFATSQERSSEDFATSVNRASQDFSTSMADARLDFSTTMSDSATDFNRQMTRMDEDYTTSVTRSTDAFSTSMARMDEDYKTSRVRATEQFLLQMSRAVEDRAKALRDMDEDFARSQARSLAAFDKSIERMRIKAANAVSDIGAQAGAQIQSMQEQFVAMFQQSSADPKAAANTLIGNLLGLGIPKEKWGDDVKAVWDAAVAQIYGSNAALAKTAGFPFFKEPTIGDASKNIGYTAGQGQSVAKNIGYTAGATHDPVSQNSAFAEMGKNAWEGWRDGFVRAMEDGTTLTAVFEALVSSVKRVLGIQSPSTVFAEIGENVVAGLKDGILDTIGGVWELITAPIARLDIANKVDNAFDSAKTWLGNLGSKITGWIGSAWDSTWSVLEDIDIQAKVVNAFSTAKEWITGLAGTGTDSVSTWIGEAWHSITDNLPTMSDVLEKVKEVFGIGAGKNGANAGVAGFFAGLKDTVSDWIPKVDEWSTLFSERIIGPFRSAINWVIDKWNNLTWSFPQFQGDWNGPLPGGDFSLGGWTVSIPQDLRIQRLADGGIVTRQTQAIVAEAGYPEAVIPLNQRGADVLAETMARYVGNSEVRGANAMQSSSPVYNNYNQSYDYRTQYTGPITVQSQDPDEMAAKLASRKRRQRLAQPIGASS